MKLLQGCKSKQRRILIDNYDISKVELYTVDRLVLFANHLLLEV